MPATIKDILLDRIRTEGPITVAEFMEVALYHPVAGYYATAPRRSGRQGDFHTSVDVGPLFGEMIAVQIAEMCERVDPQKSGFDLVEAGAGDGRLMRDILDAWSRNFPSALERVRVTLVERSAAARAAQPDTLGPWRDRVESQAELQAGISGIIIANELLDALPVHVVQFNDHGVREIYVDEIGGIFAETDGPLSEPRLADWLSQIGHPPRDGIRAEAGLAAADWIQRAAAAMDRGCLLLIDYGCEESDLLSDLHAGGTLVGYRQHSLESGWMNAPGECDLTAHVNFGALRRAATAAGLTPLGTIDQNYFLMNLGLIENLPSDQSMAALRQRLAARSLLMPGGLGSTMKVMAFGKGVDRPALRGFSAGRLT
jgi:SAM-dependent MidA family methyltransferase